jgi:hypothetical protein
VNSLSTTADGRKLFTLVGKYDVDYSEISGGALLFNMEGWGGHGDNQADAAVNADGTRVYYASGSPYACAIYDATAMQHIGMLPGGSAYPTNVEVTSDGRVICGVSSGSSVNPVFWVHTAAGAIIQGYTLPGQRPSVEPRQLVVTPDGLVVAAVSATYYDSRIVLVPIP